MGKTKQGAFDEVYHHIDAPTVQDDEYGKQFKKRKLIVPEKGQDEAYRTPLLAYMAELPWVYTRKVDGENIRVKWDGEQALWNGKSNNFQCSAEFADFMNDTFIEEIFEEKFGRDKTVILFGEKMGPKTQGNELNLKEDTFVLFDVNIDGTWLSGVNVVEVAGYFGIPSVYRFMLHGQAPTPLRELIDKCANGEFKDWEGIVAKPCIECKDYKGNRVIVKIKNRDYLRGGEQNHARRKKMSGNGNGNGNSNGNGNELRYLVEVWMYHNIVDSYRCASLDKAREWLSKGGWLKSWACGDCYFEVSKDGEKLSFDTLYENKFYSDEEEE